MPSGPWWRLAGFAAAMLTALAIGVTTGRLLGMPSRAQPAGAVPPADAVVAAVAGMGVSDAGYTLAVESTQVTAGSAATLRLRVLGPHGTPVLRYGLVGDRLAQMAVIRRDVSGYQRLSPALQADGTWTVPITVDASGSWRLIAQLAPTAADGTTKPVVLGVDLSAAGTYTPHTPPPPNRQSTVDGYTVGLSGQLQPGQAQPLLFTLTRAGTHDPAIDTASARLTLIREGDLGVLTATPDHDQAGNTTVRFWINAPSPGRYHAFLDFTADRAEHTARFTLDTATTAS